MQFRAGRGFMRIFVLVVLASMLGGASLALAGDTIPKAAWNRGLGQPLENAGGRKPALVSTGMIDDGYWQGAPVGGFGSGTFSHLSRRLCALAHQGRRAQISNRVDEPV